LLDEPLSALDAKVRAYLRHEIKQLQRRLGVTTIMVTHDQEEALSMADRVVVMNHGIIEQSGSPDRHLPRTGLPVRGRFYRQHEQAARDVTGPTEVKLGAASFACRSHGLPLNSEAILALRPEDVIPLESAESATAINAYPVTVRDMEFLGSFWKAWLTSDAFGAAEIDCHFSINAVRRLGITRA
jgi:iron(III) transport system ATP-binding protein